MPGGSQGPPARAPGPRRRRRRRLRRSTSPLVPARSRRHRQQRSVGGDLRFAWPIACPSCSPTTPAGRRGHPRGLARHGQARGDCGVEALQACTASGRSGSSPRSGRPLVRAATKWERTYRRIPPSRTSPHDARPPGSSRGSRQGQLDLWRATRDQLEGAGVLPPNIHISELCTKTHRASFIRIA